MEGYVDASICGASTSVERSQLVEFSQALVSTTLAIITKTPDKSVSVSYFALGAWWSRRILAVLAACQHQAVPNLQEDHQNPDGHLNHQKEAQ